MSRKGQSLHVISSKGQSLHVNLYLAGCKNELMASPLFIANLSCHLKSTYLALRNHKLDPDLLTAVCAECSPLLGFPGVTPSLIALSVHSVWAFVHLVLLAL